MKNKQQKNKKWQKIENNYSQFNLTNKTTKWENVPQSFISIETQQQEHTHTQIKGPPSNVFFSTSAYFMNGNT